MGGRDLGTLENQGSIKAVVGFPHGHGSTGSRFTRVEQERLRDELREHVRAHAENRPGIYRMMGPGDEVLYIGKSVRVRTRLLSYFRAKAGTKATKIIGHTHRVEWDYAPSEFAALLLELRQIKRLRPVYNVAHKRDGRYCFIKLTRESAPRLLTVGTVRGDGALYYGPFRGRARVREAISEVSDLLELRDCAASVPMRFADQPDIFGHTESPRCIRAELARCLAPCAARCTEAAYRERVELARRFLEGDADRPLRILEERMQQAADRLEFEHAAALRDRAERLEAVRRELVALHRSQTTNTFLYPVPGHAGDDRVYLIRRGLIVDERPAPRTAAQHRSLERAARELLDEFDHGPLTVQPDQVAEILLVNRWFRLNPEERERTVDSLSN